MNKLLVITALLLGTMDAAFAETQEINPALKGQLCRMIVAEMKRDLPSYSLRDCKRNLVVDDIHEQGGKLVLQVSDSNIDELLETEQWVMCEFEGEQPEITTRNVELFYCSIEG